MKNIQTGLLPSHIEIFKLIYLIEIAKFKSINIPNTQHVLSYPMQDCLLIICKRNDQYLIGKLKENYEFCPGDWDFLTSHLELTDDFKEKAIITPFYYAGLKTENIIRAYHHFVWLDQGSKLWWYFLPFLISIDDKKIRLNQEEKFAELKWVRRNEIIKFSRAGYFEYVLSKTLDVDHLYVEDYATIYDVKKGYYSFFPYEV